MDGLACASACFGDTILAIAGEKDESRKGTLEGRLIAIIKEITDEGGLDRFAEWSIKTGDIRSKYNQGRPEDRQVSSSWIGKRLKSMSLHNRLVHGYSEIRISSDEYAMILKQYGYTGRESSSSTNPLPEKAEQDQDDLRVVEGGRVSAQAQGRPDYDSPADRELYDETREILPKEGGLSQDEIKYLGYESLEEWRKDDDLPF